MKKFLNKHPEYIILASGTLLSFLYFMWGINSWKFAFIGDEWQFYIFAKEIVGQNFMLNPFQLIGVHGQNSVLGSMYQAIFLWVFGFNNAAWRLSNITLIIPASIFFFLFAREEFGKNVAIISTILLQGSAYLANYFKIGYVNPQAFFLFVLSLYLASRASHDPKIKNFILLGATLGISFYIYLGPIFPLIIWPFLLPALKIHKRKLLFRLALTGAFYTLLVLPVLFDISQIGGPTEKFITSKEFDDNSQIIINIFHNFLLFYKNFDYFYNHFVEGPYLDILSQFFALSGTVIAIAFAFKKSSYKHLLFSYVSACLALGLTSPYAYTPTTRGIFFLPFGFIFAGIGLAYFQNMKSLAKLSYIIIPAIITLNVFQSQVGVFHKAGHSATSLIIKTLQESKSANNQGKIILLLEDGHSYSGHLLPTLQQAYGLENIVFEKVYASQLSCNTLIDASALVLFLRDAAARQKVQSSPCLNDNTKILELDPNIYF